MFRLIPHVRVVALSLTLTAASLCQSVNDNINAVMSNKEVRKAATNILEATVPPGFTPTEFTVRISVGADGTVQNVSNSHSLPESLFSAAADAARQWRFPSDSDGRKSHGFQAEITFHGPVVGTVTARDGTPVAGVQVFGSKWKACCPYQRDSMTTDKSGSFRIEHPGEVLHFLPGDSFQLQSLVVTPGMSTLNVILDPASNNFTFPACSKPQRGFERIGWGEYGLQFDVPRGDAHLIRGKVDVDYIVHTVRAKHGDGRVEFWFGPYAMDSTPDDEQFVESETFATRNVVTPQGLVRGSEGGVIGRDIWGHLPNGKMWRQMAIVGEGARYRDVRPETAALFDQIINSACWVPDPKP